MIKNGQNVRAQNQPAGCIVIFTLYDSMYHVCKRS
jgi:hypothetical protein